MTEKELEGAHDRITQGEELVAAYKGLTDELEEFEGAMSVITIREGSIEVDAVKIFEGGSPKWEFDFLPEFAAFKNAVARKVQRMINKLKKEFERL